jgi:hypothetical protein
MMLFLLEYIGISTQHQKDIYHLNKTTLKKLNKLEWGFIYYHFIYEAAYFNYVYIGGTFSRHWQLEPGL